MLQTHIFSAFCIFLLSAGCCCLQLRTLLCVFRPLLLCMFGHDVCAVAKKRYQAVGFPCNRMLKLSSSRGIRIDAPVLYVSWSFEDHSVIIKALRKGLIEHEASDTGGVPRWQSSCPDRLAEATMSRYFSELCWRSLAEEFGRCCRIQQLRPLLGVRRT